MVTRREAGAAVLAASTLVASLLSAPVQAMAVPGVAGANEGDTAAFETCSAGMGSANDYSLDLFDYWSYDGGYNPDNPDGNYPISQNEGINEDHDLKFLRGGKPGDGTEDDPLGNRPHNGGTGPERVGQATIGIVQSDLGADGYPLLAGNSDLGFSQTSSLDYLFAPHDGAGKTYYPVSDPGSLLQSQGGNWVGFDSATQNAIYNSETAAFDMVKRASGTSGFFPFNDGSIDNQSWSSTQNQSIANHYFGMSFEATFMQPSDGQVQGQDMVFEYSGDDDVWVFVDNKLVLDLGGSHAAIEGSINFASGVITQRYTWQEDTRPTNLSNIFGSTFAEGTSHTIKMFYLERGHAQSNLHLNFNLEPTGYFQPCATKTLVNDTLTDAQFAFDLTPADQVTTDAINAGHLKVEDPNAFPLSAVNATDGTVVFPKVTVSNPGTYTFTMKETGATDTASNVVTDPAVYTVKVVAGPVDGVPTVTMTYLDAEGVEVTPMPGFVNTQPVGAATLGITKTLAGDNLPEALPFTFTAARLAGDEGGTGPLDGVREPANLADGITTDALGQAGQSTTASFGDFTFTKPGTYIYGVQEVMGTDWPLGLEGDSRVATVTFTVAADPADPKVLLVMTTVAPAADGDVITGGNATVAFTNTYTKPRVTATLSAAKTLAGADLDPAEAFAFTAVRRAGEAGGTGPADGVVEPTGMGSGVSTPEMSAEGSTETVSFGTITFFEPGTYVYDVSETAGTTEGLEYDARVAVVTFTVSRADDGSLSAVTTIEGTPVSGDLIDGTNATVAFVNTYTPPAPATVPSEPAPKPGPVAKTGGSGLVAAALGSLGLLAAGGLAIGGMRRRAGRGDDLQA